MRSHKKSWPETWYAYHDRLEKLKKRAKKKLPSQSRVERSWVYKIFGRALLRKEFWSFKVEPLARGLALGLFVAFTPTVGFQMLVACLLILFFPGNLPVALAACWVTNPFTAGPIYYMEYKVGGWIMAFLNDPSPAGLEHVSGTVDVYGVAGAMWIGSVIIGGASAAAGYTLTHGFVTLERKIRYSKVLHFRRKRSGKKSPRRRTRATEELKNDRE
ncbi:MAG: DUF2062 domain-containing protein [Candidatus Nitrospinota bacterium M3_3B_026]